MINALNKAIVSQQNMLEWAKPNTRTEVLSVQNLNLIRRVTDVLLAASEQIPFQLFGSLELQAFVSTASGMVEKSKNEYLKQLSAV